MRKIFSQRSSGFIPSSIKSDGSHIDPKKTNPAHQSMPPSFHSFLPIKTFFLPSLEVVVEKCLSRN